LTACSSARSPSKRSESKDLKKERRAFARRFFWTIVLPKTLVTLRRTVAPGASVSEAHQG
jgi:hypothetical protein